MPYRNLLLRNSRSIQNVVSVWKVNITLVTYLLDNCSYYKSVTLVIHQGSLLHWMMGRDLNMILIYIYPLNHMSVNMSPMITIVPNFHQLLKRPNTFYINCQRKVHTVFFFFSIEVTLVMYLVHICHPLESLHILKMYIHGCISKNKPILSLKQIHTIDS